MSTCPFFAASQSSREASVARGVASSSCSFCNEASFKSAIIPREGGPGRAAGVCKHASLDDDCGPRSQRLWPSPLGKDDESTTNQTAQPLRLAPA